MKSDSLYQTQYPLSSKRSTIFFQAYGKRHICDRLAVFCYHCTVGRKKISTALHARSKPHMASLFIAVIYLAFISLGLPDSLLGSAWPVMHMELGASLSSAGVISLIISLSTIVSALFSGILRSPSCSSCSRSSCSSPSPFGRRPPNKTARRNRRSPCLRRRRSVSKAHCASSLRGSSTLPSNRSSYFSLPSL